MMKHGKAASCLMAAALSLSLFTACGVTDKAALVRIDGGKDQISYGYGNFCARYTQALYDLMYGKQMGDQMWTDDSDKDGKTTEDEVKKQLLDTMKTQYVLKAHADEYDVKLSAEDKKKISKAADAFLKTNSREAIDQMGATKEYIEDYLTNRTIGNRMQEAVAKASKVTVSDEEANQKKITYVHFSSVAPAGTSAAAAPTTSDIQKYQADCKQLSLAADFASEARTLGVETTDYTYGQEELEAAKDKKKNGEESTATSSDGTPVPDAEILEAAEKLKEGETSDVIEIKDDGFYVLHMDSLHDEEATAAAKASLESEKQNAAYEKQVKKWKKALDWKVDKKKWARIRFIDRFEGTLYDTGTDGSGSGSDTGSAAGNQPTVTEEK